MTIFQPTFVEAPASDLLLQFAEVLAKLRASESSVAAEDTPSSSQLNVNSFAEAAAKAIESDSVLELVHDYAKGANVLLNVPESQIEGLFTLLLSLVFVSAAGSTKVESDLINLILQSFLTSSSDKGILKIKLLTQLFNALTPTSSLRCSAYTTLVKVAAKHHQLHGIAESVQHLAAWSIDWQTPAANLSTLYTLLATQLLNVGHWKVALSTMVAHINHIFNTSEPSVSVIEPLYTKAAIAGLASLTTVQDLTDLYLTPATLGILHVTAVAKLVTAYVHGDHATYVETIQTKLPGLVKSAKIANMPGMADLERATLKKFQMLYMTTLPVGHAHSLDEIMHVLNVESTRHVEILFVSAASHHLVQGKIDGINQSLVLSSAAKPHLEVHDWDALLNDLGAWKDRLNKVSHAIERLRDDDADSVLDDDIDHLDDDLGDVPVKGGEFEDEFLDPNVPVHPDYELLDE